jgi:hypothetical protein
MTNQLSPLKLKQEYDLLKSGLMDGLKTPPMIQTPMRKLSPMNHDEATKG